MTKDDLMQYSSMQNEVREIQDKINRLNGIIAKLEDRLSKIEEGGVVRDKVRGGLGGEQTYIIEGFPMEEYRSVRNNLLTKKLILNGRKSTLDALELDLMQKTNEVEEFIAGITDSRIRRIINLRFIEGLSWVDVAVLMGGGNNEDSVRMMFNRYMDKA